MFCVNVGHVLRLTAESQPQDLNPASSFYLFCAAEWPTHAVSHNAAAEKHVAVVSTLSALQHKRSYGREVKLRLI